MKSIGIVRKLDELGRVVIPMELRKTMDIKDKDPMEIFTEGETIILRKYVPSNACVFCHEVENTLLIEGKYICHSCAEKLVEVTKATGLVG